MIIKALYRSSRAEKYVKRAFLLVAVMLLLPTVAFPQGIPKELSDNPLYSHQKDIINGVKWVYEMKYRGNPFLSDKYWPLAEIRYHGEDFTGVKMNYDLYTDQFIIFIPEKGKEKYVLPRKDYLEGFTYTDSMTGVRRHFEFELVPGTKEKRLYEIAWKGRNVEYLIRHEVTTKSRIENGFLGDYIRRVGLYLIVGDRFGSFRNRRTLLALLDDHFDEMKKFIRKNRIKINIRHYDDVVRVVKYYEQLETGNAPVNKN